MRNVYQAKLMGVKKSQNLDHLLAVCDGVKKEDAGHPTAPLTPAKGQTRTAKADAPISGASTKNCF